MEATYIHGPGIDEPLEMKRGGVNYYYQRDGLDSIVGLADGAGTVVRSYRYDSFGRIIAETGAVENPYIYTGRERDAETGMYYYRARYYDPQFGRFISEDSIGFAGGDENFYNYAFSNPTNFADPFGHGVVSAPSVEAPGVGMPISGPIPITGNLTSTPATVILISSSLNYESGTGTLTLYNGSGNVVGQYPAGNNAQSGSRGAWQSGVYDYIYQTTHPDDSPDSAYGSNGNFVFEVLGCTGCGIHSGRVNTPDRRGRTGPQHATNGCIRTTDEATSRMNSLNSNGDPIISLTVR